MKNCDKTRIKKLLEKKKLSTNSKMKSIHSPFNFNFNLNSSGTTTKNNSFLKKGKSFTENNKFIKNFNSIGIINQKLSVYNLSELKKDFKRSRVYKKISCEFPSINFIKKRKINVNHNYGFTPKTYNNIFSDIRFKPFTPFLNDDTKKNNSYNKKHPRKVRNLKLIRRNRAKDKTRSKERSKK